MADQKIRLTAAEENIQGIIMASLQDNKIDDPEASKSQDKLKGYIRQCIANM